MFNFLEQKVSKGEAQLRKQPADSLGHRRAPIFHTISTRAVADTFRGIAGREGIENDSKGTYDVLLYFRCGDAASRSIGCQMAALEDKYPAERGEI